MRSYKIRSAQFKFDDFTNLGVTYPKVLTPVSARRQYFILKK